MDMQRLFSGDILQFHVLEYSIRHSDSQSPEANNLSRVYTMLDLDTRSLVYKGWLIRDED